MTSDSDTTVIPRRVRKPKPRIKFEFDFDLVAVLYGKHHRWDAGEVKPERGKK